MRIDIIFSADEVLIQQAKWKATREKTTLNQLFSEWLTEYIAQPNASEQYDTLMEGLCYVEAGGFYFDRESMNERN